MALKVDLHSHTFYSDGTFSPEELVGRAKKAGLSVLSITDHDSMEGIPAAVKSAAGDLEILPGVELTVAFRDRELHILGYGIDPRNTPFISFLKRMRAKRTDRIRKMIEKLKAKGIQISFEEVKAAAGNGAIGRPHLAEILLKKRYVPSFQEAFQQYIGDRAPCFVKEATLTVPEAVELVRSAGGVTSLAHPYRIVEDAWLPELIAAGIQGIEVYHSEHPETVSAIYRKFAEDNGLLITGGSDCHGFRKEPGPLIGTVFLPEEDFFRLREAIAAVPRK
ncbi:MAG: PHP domain-containing protein [Candidatus Omnitrophica bacterium]|nr:PHP domain-containing protein [Candidatus Omnitrophota bacterium]